MCGGGGREKDLEKKIAENKDRKTVDAERVCGAWSCGVRRRKRRGGGGGGGGVLATVTAA